MRYLIASIALATVLAWLAIALLVTADKADALPAGRPDNVYRIKPGEPMSTDGQIDIDGRIPEYHVCGMAVRGAYTFNRQTRQGVIRINVCALRRLDHTVREFRKTREHERAHARGFVHRESTPRRNPAYYP